MSSNKPKTSENIVLSPCVSNCCLDQNDICVGCYRHIDEITGWHSADSALRLEIIDKTKIRQSQKETK